MTRYELTTEAQQDLDAIADYIVEKAGIDRAIKVLNKFRDTFRRLGDMPGAGHFREDLLDRRFKFTTVYSYVVAYRWDVKPIRIIAVVHGARELTAFFERRSK